MRQIATTLDFFGAGEKLWSSRLWRGSFMATRLAIMVLACLTGCGRIGYSPGDEAGGGPGDAGAGQLEPSDGAARADASCPDIEPFALSPVEMEIAPAAVAAFNNSCGISCSLQSPTGLTYPSCVDLQLQLEQVVTEAIGHAQLQTRPSFEEGQVIAPRDAAMTRPLSPSSEAESILAELTEAAGSEAREAWRYQGQLPCQNCDSFETVMVLWYPDTRWVAVLSGSHGGG